MYADYASKVLDGTISREDAVRAISRDTKVGSAKVAPRLEAAIAEAKAEARAHTADTRKPKAPGQRAPRKPVEKAEHAEPALFAALRDELGMTNKELAAASAEAGLGSTLSRMTELTHSKGASMAMFQRVEKAWRSWAKAHRKELAARAKTAAASE